MTMLVRPLAALTLLTITLSVSATSWHDDSHYVALGPRTGYLSSAPWLIVESSAGHQQGSHS